MVGDHNKERTGAMRSADRQAGGAARQIAPRWSTCLLDKVRATGTALLEVAPAICTTRE
jgi:hypothetical protein